MFVQFDALTPGKFPARLDLQDIKLPQEIPRQRFDTLSVELRIFGNLLYSLLFADTKTLNPSIRNDLDGEHEDPWSNQRAGPF
jgi:hypothetical protein